MYVVKLTATKNELSISTTKYVLVNNSLSPTTLTISCSYPISPNINEFTSTMATIINGYEIGHNYHYYFEVTDNFNTNYFNEVISSSSFESFDYTFLYPGTYKIRVYVCDVINNGISGECETILSINNPDPCSNLYTSFDFSPIGQYENGTVNFWENTYGGTPPYVWHWIFYPDIVWGIEPQTGGKTINGMFYPNGSTSNYYGYSGTYPVTLITTDWNGCVSTCTKNVNILSLLGNWEDFSLISSAELTQNPIRIKLKEGDNDLPENYCPVHIVPMLNGMFGLNFLQSFAPYILTNMYWDVKKYNSNSSNYTNAEYIHSDYGISSGEVIMCDYTLPFQQTNVQISFANAVYFDFPFYNNNFKEGNYSVKLRATFKDDQNIPFSKEAYTDVDVINCNTISYFDGTNFTNYPIISSPYIAAGKFYLNSNINSYINQHEVHLLACDEIVLDDGFETGSKNFSAGGDLIEPCGHYQAGKKDTLLVQNKKRMENKIIVSPNPFNQYINVYYQSVDTCLTTFTLYNALGIEIEKQYYRGNNTLTFDTQILPSGFYFLEIKSKSFVKSFKLIKMNAL